MKWKGTIAKTAIVGVVAIWLAGCASNGPEGVGTNDMSATTGNQTGSITQGVNDPAVMAVIKSGKIKGTPDQIAALLHQKTFHYKTNEYAVIPDNYAALDATAALMQTPMMKDQMLVIEGNTDERGTRSYNMSLGLRRASAVAQYLQAKGVNKSQIKVISYGYEKPVDPEHNPAAWAKNRRVHLVLEQSVNLSHG